MQRHIASKIVYFVYIFSNSQFLTTQLCIISVFKINKHRCQQQQHKRHFPEQNNFEDGHKKIWPTFRGALIYNLILACAHPFAGDWRLVVPFSVNFPDWPFGVGSAARHRTPRMNCFSVLLSSGVGLTTLKHLFLPCSSFKLAPEQF